jgi:hypothetical protein
MSGRFWGEAVQTAVYLLNRSPTRCLKGKTPYEAWFGKKPIVRHLKVFGCVAFVKVTRPHLSKLDARGLKTVFIGYEEGSKAYRLYDPVANRVHISRDVVFDEGVFWDWEESRTGTSDIEPFTVEYIVTKSLSGGAGSSNDIGSLYAPRTSSLASVSSAQKPVEYVAPPTTDDALDADVDSEVVPRYRKIENLIRDPQVAGLAARDVDIAELNAISAEEPSTFAQAEREACWQEAMNEEMKSINANKTWSLEDLPSGHRAIGLKWVCRLKRNEAGDVVKHKARLMAKGYVQKAGIDFEEAFTPVARLESVRLLLSIVGHCNWEVHHMDVKSAFLNGEIKEIVFVKQPPGFIDPKHPGKVLRLHKALYGLRQAPRAWNTKLNQALIRLGFRRCESEHSMYTRGGGARHLIIGVYVDDLIITGGDREELTKFKVEMQKVFKR